MASRQRKKSLGEATTQAVAGVEQKIERALTILWDELHPWQQDNHYIHTGYRPASFSLRRSFASLLHVHNESVNIYTHLLGALLAAGALFSLHASLLPRLHTFTPADVAAFSLFLASCAACLALSATYHTISNHSAQVARIGNKLDYLGITILIAGSFSSLIHYGFHECRPDLRAAYRTFIGILSLACACVSVLDRFRTPQWRPYRAAMFVALGLSGVVPMLHGAALYGYDGLNARVGLPWVLAEAVGYIAGAAIYAARIPERWAPDRFDLLGASHQIFHVFVCAAAASHWHALVLAWDFEQSGAATCP